MAGSEAGVLLINHRPETSGKGVYTHALGSALSRNSGFKVTLRTRHSQVLDKFFRKSSHIPPAVKLEEFLSAINQLSFMTTIPSGYDIYHFTSEILAFLARGRKPSVVTVHDVLAFSDPNNYGKSSSSFYQFIYRQIRFADRVICISEQAESELLHCLGGRIDRDIIRVVQPGVDHETYRPRNKTLARELLGLSDRAKILLHVGTEEPRKNLPSLLKAFALVHSKMPEALLVRVGEPTRETSEIIADLGIGKHVVYLRPSLELFPQVYNAADVFSLPSLCEGFGFPLLEAMASGCPVIASNRGPLDSIVSDSGTLVPPLDSSKLATSILELFQDDDLRGSMGKEAYERSQLFSWEKCAMATAAVYGEVL